MATTDAVEPTTSADAIAGEEAQVLAPEAPGMSERLNGGKPFRKYLLWYGLAGAAITATWGALAGVAMPNHVQLIEMANFFTGADAGLDLAALTDLKAQVDAGTVTATAEHARQLDLLAQFEAARAQSLALVSSVGVLVTMFVQPIAGYLSDRTRTRWGRRAPWIAAGAVIGSIALAAMRFSPTIGALILAWAVAQATINLAQGPLNTTVADRVTAGKVGTASAVTGLGMMVGGVAGGVGAGVAFAALGLNVYFPFAIAVAAFALIFVLVARDRSSLDLEVEPVRLGRFFASFVLPLKDADYRWVWIAKVIMAFGYATSTAFSIYMLQSYVQPALSQQEATLMAPMLALVGLPGTIVAMIVAGRWSDRIQRRKPFVFWSSVAMAASFLLPLLWPAVPAMFLQAIIAGLAFGTFLVVDQALFIAVIPDHKEAGRDLGVAAMGGNLGQALGPMIGAQIVVITAGYRMVWVAAIVLVALAALAILPVKRAR
ncbi:MFS transporter [Demequina silvatica]|uniref:MFS transporter n=1 Tax=Demequina silvatica TaxID=1638988 RepID=UPI0007803135|nr:MFS transporter [Demequina silvatica]